MSSSNIERRIDLTSERPLIDEAVVDVVLEAMAPYGWPSSKDLIRYERLFLGLTNNRMASHAIPCERAVCTTWMLD